MLDPAFLLLLQQPGEEAVVLKAGIVSSDVLEVVKQEEVHIVSLKVLQGRLEHLLAGLERGAAVHIGDLRGYLVAAPGVAAQGPAGHDLGLTVCRSRVEVIDSVGDGIIDHSVDGVLVKATGAALGRKAHTAEAEQAEGLPHLAPGARVYLAPGRSFVPGSGDAGGPGSLRLEEGASYCKPHTGEEQALEGLAASDLVIHISFGVNYRKDNQKHENIRTQGLDCRQKDLYLINLTG